MGANMIQISQEIKKNYEKFRFFLQISLQKLLM